MLISTLVIWEEEDNITIYSYKNCVIYTDMPGKRLEVNKAGASKGEVAPEPAFELSSDKRGGCGGGRSGVCEIH